MSEPEVTLTGIERHQPLEERPDPFERSAIRVAERLLEQRVDLGQIAVDHLKGEVFLAREVVVERSLRNARRDEQILDARRVVAALEQRGESDVQQPAFGDVQRTRRGRDSRVEVMASRV